MKSERLLILACFLPSFICYSQNPEPAATPAQVHAPGPAAPAPAAPAPAAPGPAAGTASSSYVIGPSDELTVTVWKEPTLSGSILVRPDGMITLPLLGDVQASGLTPLQLADQVAAKLKKYVQDPNVSVVVGSIHSKVIYLLGEVGRKGPVEMTSGMTLLDAIGSAGGLTDYANAKKIYILRDQAGKHQRIPVHYKEALKGNSQFNLILEPGDTIVVP
jgi:polysaccharide export outer membrane protein